MHKTFECKGCGKIFHSKNITAASRHYPLGTVVVVHCVQTGRDVTLTITDRGPFGHNFDLDLSKSAFIALGLNPKQG